MSRRRLALASLALCGAMAVPAAVFLGLGPGRPIPGDLFGGIGGASMLLTSLAFATVGAIASRLPAKPIGWIFWQQRRVDAVVAVLVREHRYRSTDGAGTDPQAVPALLPMRTCAESRSAWR